MQVTGCSNGNFICIVANSKLFTQTLKNIENNYDNYIIGGLVNFLGYKSLNDILSKISTSDNPIIILRYLHGIKKEAYLLYAKIISDNLTHIRINSNEDQQFSSDDYSVILPSLISGAYISNHFTCLSLL